MLRRRRAVGPAGGEAPLLAGGGRHHQRPALLPEPLLALRRHRQVRRVLRVREREREPKRQPRRPGQRNACGEIFCENLGPESETVRLGAPAGQREREIPAGRSIKIWDLESKNIVAELAPEDIPPTGPKAIRVRRPVRLHSAPTPRSAVVPNRRLGAQAGYVCVSVGGHTAFVRLPGRGRVNSSGLAAPGVSGGLPGGCPDPDGRSPSPSHSFPPCKPHPFASARSVRA